ncbi:lysophospholipid acyltransferase family protein [Rhizohabitans arisaemae]|uniref:lysophospholipid acyltransferase family protein n=1 Tax=Rhizohabitans arisaemae TaxID=2720610 RepID=UPI0024B082F7|nr:lysophospholipid acyltransferase family protein [Rhizohabitans arisaemae]
MVYWLLKYVFIGPVARLVFRPKAEGLHHIPEEGPAILAGNHLSVYDPVFLSLVVKRRIYYLAKLEYFTGKGVLGFLFGRVVGEAGAIPVDRSGGKAATTSLDIAGRVIEKGRLFCLYPEGTRSPDGRLHRGKTGVVRLALRTGAPVIPVAMLNTHEIQPPGRILPKIRRARVRIGEPLDFSAHRGQAGDPATERRLTDEVMNALQKISGQEYVDVYAKRKPGGSATS